LELLARYRDRYRLRICHYCLMTNHWHLVVWPERDDDLTAFVRWLTHTHAMRWHAHYHTQGTGHIYQGRFKSFPVQEDEHLYAVLRYVERNALRAGLAARAEAWRWGSLWRRQHRDARPPLALHPGPVPEPDNWVEWVNQPQTEAELKAVRRSVARGLPFGDESWQRRTAERLGLQQALRPRGRPRKVQAAPPDEGVGTSGGFPAAHTPPGRIASCRSVACRSRGQRPKQEKPRMAERILPVVRAMVLCDEVVRHPDRGTFELVEIRTSIRAAAFPYRHPQLCVYLELTGHPSTVSSFIGAVQADTSQDVFQSPAHPLSFPGPLTIV
jgi:putative transposase